MHQYPHQRVLIAIGVSKTDLMVVKSNDLTPMSENWDYGPQIIFLEAFHRTFPLEPCVPEPAQGSKPAFTASTNGSGSYRSRGFSR